jgi:hypothetical protein
LGVAQSSSEGLIQSNLLSGRVLDLGTGEPLPGASVFIANTTIGTMTDTNGNYRLKKVPPGAYTLVITYIGYERHTLPIQVIGADTLQHVIHLKPRLIGMDLIEVIAGRDGIITPESSQWSHAFSKFKDLFLGISRYAKACRILNPDTIYFYYDDKKNIFEAFSDMPIQVENMALGYRLSIILESFRSTSTSIEYKVYPQFEELVPESMDDRTRWDKNRGAAYKGSFKHFLSALARDKLDEEQFAVTYTATLSPKVKVFTGAGLRGSYLWATDSGPEMTVGSFNPEDILTPEALGLLRMQFSGYLLIRRGIDEYASIKLNNSYALVDTLGNLHTPEAFTKYGIWWEERIGDLLPSDYRPEI